MIPNIQRIALVALLFAAQPALAHAGPVAEVTNAVSAPSPEALRLVHGACAQTLTNINADLLRLVHTFPVLDGISNARIVSLEPQIWRNATWESHRLSYQKNVRTVQAAPGPSGTDPQQSEGQAVEVGGVELQIDLVQHPGKIQRTREYTLPYGAGQNRLKLVYYLKANPPDPALEKSVREVIERHVELLRKALGAK